MKAHHAEGLEQYYSDSEGLLSYPGNNNIIDIESDASINFTLVDEPQQELYKSEDIVNIDFTEVLEQFRLQHKNMLNLAGTTEIEADTYAENNLTLANNLQQQWHKVSLTKEEINNIILPWHLSEKGDIELIPKTGLTVKETVEKLSNMKEQFAKKSEVCWNKIIWTSKMPLNLLFLSTKPIDTRDYDHINKEGIFHLDGLHRMIAWSLNNHINENKITAYISGSKSEIVKFLFNKKIDQNI